jgi:hypothetical protein
LAYDQYTPLGYCISGDYQMEEQVILWSNIM